MQNKSEKEIREIDKILDSNLDWIEIAGIALNHRLGGYIYKGLNTSQQKKMPKEVVKALELLVRAQKEQFEENLEEICKVNDALEEAKIKFAVLKGAFFGCEMYEKGTRRSNDIDLLVYEDDLGKLDTCLRAMGYIQSNMSNGEMVEATKKEKIIQRMNYHDLVPYVKKTKMGILELDINFLFDGNKNLIDKNVYEMGTMVYKGRYRITGLNPYTNLAFLCCHFTEKLQIPYGRKENVTLHYIRLWI